LIHSGLEKPLSHGWVESSEGLKDDSQFLLARELIVRDFLWFFQSAGDRCCVRTTKENWPGT